MTGNATATAGLELVSLNLWCNMKIKHHSTNASVRGNLLSIRVRRHKYGKLPRMSSLRSWFLPMADDFRDRASQMWKTSSPRSTSTVVIGCKKKMHYMVNNNEEHREDDGHYWLMKEYKLSNVILHQFDDDRRDYVLCAIKKKFIETRSSEMQNFSDEFEAIQCNVAWHEGLECKEFQRLGRSDERGSKCKRYVEK
ncbi:hypothetical protein FXO38_29435 [Capsicum annuum]|nr:hypothetical protein FXO38_29435 [Capsicum annuum]